MIYWTISLSKAENVTSLGRVWRFTGDMLSPVAAVLSFMASRGSSKGPFFRFFNGQPLTKVKLQSTFKKHCVAWVRHGKTSLVIASASELPLQQQMEDQKTLFFHMLGHSNSSAFLVYICTPREKLAQLAQAIAITVFLLLHTTILLIYRQLFRQCHCHCVGNGRQPLLRELNGQVSQKYSLA